MSRTLIESICIPAQPYEVNPPSQTAAPFAGAVAWHAGGRRLYTSGHSIWNTMEYRMQPKSANTVRGILIQKHVDSETVFFFFWVSMCLLVQCRCLFSIGLMNDMLAFVSFCSAPNRPRVSSACKMALPGGCCSREGGPCSQGAGAVWRKAFVSHICDNVATEGMSLRLARWHQRLKKSESHYLTSWF